MTSAREYTPGLVLAAALSWMCGCAARSAPASYRLFNTHDQRILVPPGVKDPAATRRAFDLRAGKDQRDCVGAGGGIELISRRNDLRVIVDGALLEQQPAGWLAAWADSLEERGCVASGSALEVARRVARSVPLPLQAEHRLLNHDVRASGFTDLLPGYRLRVVSPVFREGASQGASASPGKERVEQTPGGLTLSLQASPELVGYETAWYKVEPRAQGAGSRIVPLYADLHQEGEVTRQPAPRVSHLDFDPSMAYFRMLFMSRRTDSNDHDIIVVAAPGKPLLEKRTRAIQANAASCEAELPAVAGTRAEDAAGGVTLSGSTHAHPAGTLKTACLVVPRQVAVVAFLAVRVQGEDVLVQPGATLAHALREAGADIEQSLVTVEVRKPYDDRLALVEAVHATADLLALPLSGGEEISW